MPHEIMIIVIVAIVAGSLTSMTKIIFGHIQSRSPKKIESEGSSMTTSELEHLIQASVQKGNASLEARFDELEDRIDGLDGKNALPPAQDDRV